MQGDPQWVESLLNKAWNHARNELEHFVHDFGRSFQRWLDHHWPSLHLGQWQVPLDRFLRDWQLDGITLEDYSYEELVAWLQAWEAHFGSLEIFGHHAKAASHDEHEIHPFEGASPTSPFVEQEKQPRPERDPIILAQAPAQQAATPQEPRAFPNEFGKFPPRPEFPGDALWYRKPENDTTMVALRGHVRSSIPIEIWWALSQGGLKIIVGKTMKDMGTQGEAAAGGASAGRYSSGRGVIYIPITLANGQPNKFIERNLRHEIGHAFDHMINGSVDPQFMDKYRAALTSILDNKVNTAGTGLTPFVPRRTDEAYAAREAFAESFAEATKPDTQPTPGDSSPQAGFFRKYFRNLIEHVRTVIADYVRLHPLSSEDKQIVVEQRAAEDKQRSQGAQ